VAYKIFVALILLLGIAVICAAQFSIPTLFSADGYLHIRMAQVLRDQGPHYQFHWAKFSTFADHFADKDFLYHVLLIPFTFFSNIFLGAKISAALFASLLFVVFWLIIRRYCQVRWCRVLLLALFFCSGPYLQMLSQPRNMILVITLLLFYVRWAIEKKPWRILIVGVVYSLTHVSAPYIVLFGILIETVRYMAEKNFYWKNIIAAFVGMLGGMLIHPNFPNNFLVFYLNGFLVSVFALKWGLELGAEFFPIDTRSYALGYPAILIAVVLLIMMGLSRNKKISTATQIWMGMAGYFFIFSFFSQRYLVYAYPFVLVSAGGYFSDWWRSGERLKFFQQSRFVKIVGITGISLALLFLARNAYLEFKERLFGELVYNSHYEAVGKWMAKNIPAGETIFHANWSDSQYLIGLNPKDDYFVTLDPIYMYYWNKDKYKLYREIAFGKNTDPYTQLKETFGVRYGYAGKNYFYGLIDQIRGSPEKFEILGEDQLGVIFKLK